MKAWQGGNAIKDHNNDHGHLIINKKVLKSN